MEARKQQLVRRHRRNKRILMVVALPILVALDWFGSWGTAPVVLVLAWIAHEAWFSDHLFYSPRDDYRHAFVPDSLSLPILLDRHGQITLHEGVWPETADTLVLAIHVRSNWLGRCLDPHVLIGEGEDLDRQDFERGVNGMRFLNLSACLPLLRTGQLKLSGRFCTLGREATLYCFSNPDYTRQRVMVLAPHADDAELAAFGLYSRSQDVSIVTLTQGEIEADFYRRLGLSDAAAARLKGRLRSWSSQTVPLWGGVEPSRCVQLGYYCMQLRQMESEPSMPFASRESGDSDIRSVRRFNAMKLPADMDGSPTWHNLTADLAALLQHFKPEVVVLPHPELDPHPDHIQTGRALRQAIEQSDWRPDVQLLYANHLADNDRWPMGPAGYGIALPPCIEPLPADKLWCLQLDDSVLLDKSQALAMQHDLQTPLPFKKRLRRLIQWCLAARRWPQAGEDEFFRKAVRRHELFWVRPFENTETL